ncbi:MAG: hypothetical protein ACXVAU_18245 [Mucilaginibacter sp.]
MYILLVPQRWRRYSYARCQEQIHLSPFGEHGGKKQVAVDSNDLPPSYKKRKFFQGAPLTNPSALPGNLVKYSPKDSTYEIKTLRPIIKPSTQSLTNMIEDGMLYSGKVTQKTGFNGSYLIEGLQAGPNEVMELSIRDYARFFVPDSVIDIETIKTVAQSIPQDERKNYYYVKSITLSQIDYQKFTLSKFDVTKNASYITIGGKVYSTTGKPLGERIITMFIVPLETLMNGPTGNK